jgi:galactonate dehydratase
VKVVGVKSYILDSPGRHYVLVKVQTDEGIYGWGEGTLEYKEKTVRAAIHELEGMIVGEDPTRVD